MTTITTQDATPVPTATGRSIWRTAGTAGAVAALATTAIGGIARAADVPLRLGTFQVQVQAFAVLTLLGAVLGAVIALQLHKRSAQPRRTFVAATVVLTALSVLPDVTADATTATKLTLVSAHLIAAAVIIPALAARLSAGRTR